VHPTEAPALLEPALRKLLEAVLLGKESSLIVSGMLASVSVMPEFLSNRSLRALCSSGLLTA